MKVAFAVNATLVTGCVMRKSAPIAMALLHSKQNLFRCIVAASIHFSIVLGLKN